jgi:hypothetical protein
VDLLTQRTLEKENTMAEESIARRRYNKLLNISEEPEHKNRDKLIMDLVRIYQTTNDKEQAKKNAKEKLTDKEYNVFLFEVENKGV